MFGTDRLGVREMQALSIKNLRRQATSLGVSVLHDERNTTSQN